MIDEGIIKFNYICENKILLKESQITTDICNIHKILFEQRLVGFDHTHKVSFGNISHRVNEQKMIVTASDCSKYPTIYNEHLCLINQVNLENNNVTYEGMRPPSSESMTHFYCYQSNQKIQVVVHIHNGKIWEKYINKRYPSDHSYRYVIPKEIPYGTPQMALAVQNILGNQTAVCCGMAMQGHQDGIIYVAESIERVMTLIEKDLLM